MGMVYARETSSHPSWSRSCNRIAAPIETAFWVRAVRHGGRGTTPPQERWAEIAVRAKREGLRAGARELEVSDEPVRTAVRQVE